MFEMMERVFTIDDLMKVTFITPRLNLYIVDKHVYMTPKMVTQGLTLGLVCPCAYVFICLGSNVHMVLYVLVQNRLFF